MGKENIERYKENWQNKDMNGNERYRNIGNLKDEDMKGTGRIKI